MSTPGGPPPTHPRRFGEAFWVVVGVALTVTGSIVTNYLDRESEQEAARRASQQAAYGAVLSAEREVYSADLRVLSPGKDEDQPTRSDRRKADELRRAFFRSADLAKIVASDEVLPLLQDRIDREYVLRKRIRSTADQSVKGNSPEVRSRLAATKKLATPRAKEMKLLIEAMTDDVGRD